VPQDDYYTFACVKSEASAFSVAYTELDSTQREHTPANVSNIDKN